MKSLCRQKEEKLLNEKYPEDANKSPDQDDLSLDYQSALKRNKQLKQVDNGQEYKGNVKE